jgi:hypothetical protein
MYWIKGEKYERETSKLYLSHQSFSQRRYLEDRFTQIISLKGLFLEAFANMDTCCP